jgi:hypothetical protein
MPAFARSRARDSPPLLATASTASALVLGPMNLGYITSSLICKWLRF